MVTDTQHEIHPDEPLVLAAGVDATLARAVLAAPARRRVHENRRGVVEEVAVGAARFARKRYRGGPLRGLLGRLAARRSWRVLVEGAARGLPLPEPVCLVAGSRAPALVTRWCEGDHIHLVHARERERFARDPAALDGFLGAIADTAVALLGGAVPEGAAEGSVVRLAVRTNDLAPHNVLIGETATGWRARFVDLDDARLVPRVPVRRILDNLMQLGHLPPTVPVRHRLRLLDLFLERGGAALLGDAARDRRALRHRLAAMIEERDQRKMERHRGENPTDHPYPGWGLDRAGKPVR